MQCVRELGISLVYHCILTDSMEVPMPKYLVQANYVGEGVKGLLKEGGSS